MPLDPFFAALVEKQKAAGWPGFAAGSPGQARALVAAGRSLLGRGPTMADIRDIAVPARAGAVPARLFTPEGAQPGLTVYLHGGGWAIGALDDFDTLARELAERSKIPLLLPDYRLAPEHPFPAGLEDCEDALLWARAQAGPGAPLTVAGDSAGANLATVALRRLGGRVRAAAQALVYPVVDCDFDRASYAAHGTGLPLTRTDMEWFFGHYAAADRRADPDVSPLRAADLGGLPPTLIVTAECDVLCDEGAAYAARLAEAGVPATLRRLEGATHGFIRLHNHHEGARCVVAEIAAFVAGPAKNGA